MHTHEVEGIYSAHHAGAVVKAREIEPHEEWDVLVQRLGEPAAEYVNVTREALLALAAAHGLCPEIVLKYGGRL